MQALLYYMVYPFLWILSRLPSPVLYLISDGLFFVIHYIIQYRKKVVLHNLKVAFPDKPQSEINRIHKASSRHFCDTFIEMIMSMGLSREQMRRRFEYTNPELLEDLAKKKRPVVVLFGHQASYEWTMCLDGQVPYKSYAVYKPLANTYFNQLIKRIRSKFNTILIPSAMAIKIITDSIHKKELALYGLIADQAPARYRASYFTRFFNTTSAVFKGGERIARANDTAVVFLAVTKTKRGHYQATFQEITTHGSQTAEWEITDRFFDLLEEQIKQQPEYYLWSHKRWKVTPQNAKRTVVLSPRVQR